MSLIQKTSLSKQSITICQDSLIKQLRSSLDFQHCQTSKSKVISQLTTLSQSANKFKQPTSGVRSNKHHHDRSVIISKTIQDSLTIQDQDSVQISDFKQSHCGQIYTNRKSPMVDKFIERALSRHKSSADKSRQHPLKKQETSKRSQKKNQTQLLSFQSNSSNNELNSSDALRRSIICSQERLKQILATSKMMQNATSQNLSKQQHQTIVKQPSTKITSKKVMRQHSKSQCMTEFSANHPNDIKEKVIQNVKIIRDLTPKTSDAKILTVHSVKQKYLNQVKKLQNKSHTPVASSKQDYSSIERDKSISNASFSENRTPKTMTTDRSQLDKSMDQDSLKSKMNLLRMKMNNYLKEINLVIIKEFLKSKYPPSKQGFKAARCLCILLNAFYAYPGYKSCMFQQWDQVLQFLNYRYNYLMQDIENLRTKCENHRAQVNKPMIDYLKKVILSHNDEDFSTNDIMASPKVQNLIYKPIFCFTFYLLGYLNIRDHFLQSKKTQSRSSSPYTIRPINNSESTDTIKHIKQNENKPKKRIVKSSSAVHAKPAQRQFGQNIANQIFQTIQRVLQPEDKQQVIQKENPLQTNSSRQHSLKIIQEDRCSTYHSINSQSDHDLSVDMTSQIQNVQILSPALAYDSVDQQHDIKTGSFGKHDNCFSFQASAQLQLQNHPYEESSDNESNHRSLDHSHLHLEQTPDDVERDSIDRRLAETLKNNIEAFQREEKIKVEDLISKVRQSSIGDHDVFVSSKKRYSLVLQSNQKQQYSVESSNKQKMLEQAFEEFSQQRQLNLENDEENQDIKLRNKQSNEIQEKEQIIKLLKERRTSSNQRSRGQELEKKTNETIIHLKKQMVDKEDLQNSINYEFKEVAKKIRPVLTGRQKKSGYEKGMKVDKDRILKTDKLLEKLQYKVVPSNNLR